MDLNDYTLDWSVRFGVYGGFALATLLAAITGTGWWTYAVVVIAFGLSGFSLVKLFLAPPHTRKKVGNE